MPIKRCKLPGGGRGYQWGNRGKCYADRAGAEAQARAAYSAGYREEKVDLPSMLKEFTQSSSPTSGITHYGGEPKKKKKKLTSLIDLVPHPVLKAQVDDAAHEASTSPFNLKTPPSREQQHAGNYPKGHLTISGVDISIENPQYSARRGKDWVQEMTAHYGYILGTVGADGDHVDCFVRAGTDDGYQGPVFVVNQNNEAGLWDEHKVMIGWTSKDQAQRAYENTTGLHDILYPVQLLDRSRVIK